MYECKKDFPISGLCRSLVCRLWQCRREKEDTAAEKTAIVGDDRDGHGCIASAGYTWSEVQKDCIRLWEKESAWMRWMMRRGACF